MQNPAFQGKGTSAGCSFAGAPIHEDGLENMDEDEPNIIIPFGLIITYGTNRLFTILFHPGGPQAQKKALSHS